MSAISPPRAATRRRLLSRQTVVDHVWAYGFFALALIGLAVLTVGPIVASFVLSFTDWDLLGPARWVGLDNFAKLTRDATFWRALFNTILFVSISVPLGMALSLGLALVLDRRMRGMGLYRTLFLLPIIASSVATALIWGLLLDPVVGPVNYVLRTLGLPQPGWLGDTFWAMPSIILMSIWKGFGFSVVIFLAGLQGIPIELHEAAQLDGAGRWSRFRHITLPLLSPTTFFVLLVSIIASFQVFDTTWVLTKGGPQDSTLTLVYYVYQTGFQQTRMGYASAVSYVLFAMTLLIVGVQWLSQRRWVHYQ